MKTRLFAVLALVTLALSCKNALPVDPTLACRDITITGPVTGPVCGNNNTTTTTVTQAPSPTPSPSASPNQCALPASTSARCDQAPPKFELTVANAQSTISPVPITEAAYVAALVSALRSRGVCAIAGTGSAGNGVPTDEIVVKTSNTESETFDVWLSTNLPWLNYKTTCLPARF